MRRIIFFALLVAFSGSRPSAAIAQSQAEITRQAGEALEKADADLNRIYQKVIAQQAEDPKFAATLKQAQRAWLGFVDAHMKVLFYVPEGENPRTLYGSSYAAEYAAAKEALIKARIEQLQAFLRE